MENVTQFLDTAPDVDYLLIKVVVIFSLHGACRRAELLNLTVDDITDTGSILIVNLNETKTKKIRTFTVTNDLHGYELYRQYVSLRPSHVKHIRFFLCYKSAKCSIQPVGINSFAKFPKEIATFLQLPDANTYTGHCLRRTSATLLADSGADLLTLKRHGGWRSNNVAEGYIEESVKNKVKISKQIFQEALQPTSTKNNVTDDSNEIKITTETQVLQPMTSMKNDYQKENEPSNDIIPAGTVIEQTNTFQRDTEKRNSCITSCTFTSCTVNINIH